MPDTLTLAGTQSRSQDAGRRGRRGHDCFLTMHSAPVAKTRQLMFPDGLRNCTKLCARAEPAAEPATRNARSAARSTPRRYSYQAPDTAAGDAPDKNRTRL